MEMENPICSRLCVDLMNSETRSRGSVELLSIELYVLVSRSGLPLSSFSPALSLAKSLFELCYRPRYADDRECDTESISGHTSNQLLLLEHQLRERERLQQHPLTHNRPLAADRGPAGS